MNTMTILQANLELLTRVNPELARRVIGTAPAAVEVIPTACGAPSLRLRDAGGRPFTLHSTLDPLREAERLVDSQLRPESNACLVYGFGLGYHVERLAQRLPPEAALLVVEPQIAIFRAVLGVRDLRPLLGNPAIHWAVGEPVAQVPAWFGAIFRVVTLEGASIIAHGPSVKLCGEYFEILDGLCRKWLVTVGGNFLTNVSAVRTYLSNTLENIPAIVDSPPIGRLFDRFRGVPGIVISAGPSLDRNLGLLRVLEEHAVLICVDTALGPLHRAGIRPHLVLAGDAGEANYRHTEKLGATGAALVAEPMTHPRIVSEFQGRRFIMSFNEVLMQQLAKQLGDFGVVKAWGSISTGAFDLARRLGCDPIVLVGQDLAFSDGRYYAHGTYQEARWLRELAWPKTLDDTHRWRMAREDALDLTDCFGRPGRTSKALEAYRHYLEREISLTTAKVINATGGGSLLAGAEHLPLEQVLWRHARRKRPVRQLIEQAGGGRSRREVDKLLAYLRATARRLERAAGYCNEGFERARLLHQALSQDRPADYREMEQAYARFYAEQEVLVMLEHANQGGLLSFQRGAEKLKGRALDDEVMGEAARLHGAFFASFYQTAGLLRRAFERAALGLELRLSGAAEPAAAAAERPLKAAG